MGSAEPEQQEHVCPECKFSGRLGHRAGCSRPDDVEVSDDPSGRFDALLTLRGAAAATARTAKIDAVVQEHCGRLTCVVCVEALHTALTWCGLRENEDYRLGMERDGPLLILAMSSFGQEVLWPFFPHEGEA